MEEPIKFTVDGHTLHGMLGVPASAEPSHRAVVLIHGWGGYRAGPHRMLVRAARRLISEGFFTLRFDLRGRGDSDGDGRETCLDDMIADTLGAVDFAAEQTRASSITLLGMCSGSNVAIGAATLRPDTLRELALWSILPFQPEQGKSQQRRRAFFYIKQYFQKAMRLETWKRLFRGDVNVKMVGKTIAGDKSPKACETNLKDSERNIMSDFATFDGHALFITGSKDPEGLVGRELFETTCTNKKIAADFHLVEGATHSYYSHAHEFEVIDTTLDWLKANNK